MRKITFRAWYKDTDVENSVGEMLLWDEVKQHSMFWLNRDNPDFTYLQSTGLVDKNGKECYEGDILSGARDVQWDGESAGFVVVMNEFDLKLSLKGMSFEIIGNIYENADLLK